MAFDKIQMISHEVKKLSGSVVKFFESVTLSMSRVEAINGTGYSLYTATTQETSRGNRIEKFDFIASGPNGTAEVVQIEWLGWQDCPQART